MTNQQITSFLNTPKDKRSEKEAKIKIIDTYLHQRSKLIVRKGILSCQK